MKKMLAIVMSILMVGMIMVGCGTKSEGEGSGFEIALITDKGNIDDKSFNQGSWEGVVEFAKANKITHSTTSQKKLLMLDTLQPSILL